MAYVDTAFFDSTHYHSAISEGVDTPPVLVQSTGPKYSGVGPTKFQYTVWNTERLKHPSRWLRLELVFESGAGWGKMGGGVR